MLSGYWVQRTSLILRYICSIWYAAWWYATFLRSTFWWPIYMNEIMLCHNDVLPNTFMGFMRFFMNYICLYLKGLMKNACIKTSRVESSIDSSTSVWKYFIWENRWWTLISEACLLVSLTTWSLVSIHVIL